MFKFLKKIFIIELEFFFNIVYDEVTQTGKVSIMAENTSTRLKTIMVQRGLDRKSVV